MKNKKRLIVLIIILIILIGFYIFTGKNKNTNTNNSNQNQNTVVDNFDKVIATGAGNEPGWVIKINGHIPHQDKVISNMVLDYGDTVWSGALTITNQVSFANNFQYKGEVHQVVNSQVTNTVKNIVVDFTKKDCHDPKGDLHKYTVNLNFAGAKNYQGCADVLE